MKIREVKQNKKDYLALLLLADWTNVNKLDSKKGKLKKR